MNRLEAAGLMQRQPDPSDRRRVLIHLTRSARESTGALLAGLDLRLSAALDARDPTDLTTVAPFFTLLAR